MSTHLLGRGTIVLSFLLSFLVGSVTSASADAHKDRTVILITLDGFPAWMWNKADLVVPNLRKLAAEGALAGTMTVVNPSITWINHTSLATGVVPRKHGVLYNGLLVRPGPSLPLHIEPWRNKEELVHVPTIYDAAFKAGLKTAQVDWVAILNSGTINDEFLEIPNVDGKIEQELINAGVVSVDDIKNFTRKDITYRDEIWTRAGCHILETHKPNLLLFHLLTTDSMNHRYGPGTLASYAAYAYADRLVGDLVDSIRRAGLRDKTTIIVTTDHGFKRLNKVIYGNVALRNAGMLRVEDKKVSSCDAYVMAEGGMAFVYVTNPAKRTDLLPKLKEMFAKQEGVAQVVDGNDGHSLGMPKPDENQGMGDLVLFAKAGYAFKDNVTSETSVAESKDYLGTHGYLASDPELDGFMIASGCGIKPGTKVEGRINNVDIAPTIAELLGVSLPNVDGRVLKEILK